MKFTSAVGVKLFTLWMISFKERCFLFSPGLWWPSGLEELSAFPLLCCRLSDTDAAWGAAVATAVVRMKNMKTFMLGPLVLVCSPGLEVLSSVYSASVFCTSFSSFISVRARGCDWTTYVSGNPFWYLDEDIDTFYEAKFAQLFFLGQDFFLNSLNRV